MPAEAARPTFADLQRELPVSSPRAWRFAAQRAASRAGALVSDGLRVGYRHGFESGPFMDRVYADTPSGRTAIGREIDRRLLRRRTCVAFRDIRALAEQAIRDALAATDGPAPVVADLASGPAPYLLSAVAAHPDARAVMCDIAQPALDGARAAAARLGVAELVAPGQIVFNVQTRNPEIEYIARVWVNAQGERCVWRLRPVEQILGYAAAAGYTPAEVTADRFGIYRVVRLVRAETP